MPTIWTKSWILTAAFMALPQLQPALSQDSPIPSQAGRFQLNASITERSQLSRAEVDRSALGMGSLANSSPASKDSLIATSRVPSAMAPLSDEVPGSYLKEYNVEWAKWVSTVADRWFYVLRNVEYNFGVQFSTPRPALIQFTCYADGTIGHVVLKQSSGIPMYDRLQIESLLAAAPTPPFPAGTKRTSITLVQGWESHPKRPGEQDFQPGSFGKDFPRERVRQWSQRQ